MRHMSLLLFLGLALAVSNGAGEIQFIYSGFTGSNLTLDGSAMVMPDGLLQLTNGAEQVKGHAIYPTPLFFHKSDPNNTVQSFSVTFVFAIISDVSNLNNNGMAFFISPSNNFSDAFPGQFLGLLNPDTNGDPRNHLFAVELGTVSVFSNDFGDVEGNHVGISINSLRSIDSSVPRFFDNNSRQFEELYLGGHEPMEVLVDYDRETKKINVTIAPLNMAKPIYPMISTTYDLSTVITEPAYVGISASTGTTIGTKHYVLGWGFGMRKSAPQIDMAKLPKLPHVESKAHSKIMDIVLPIAIATFFLIMGTILFVLVRGRLLSADLLEDWETEFGAHRFSYKDLFHATEGFNNKHLIGRGGFGQVYKGVLPSSKADVAVKRVSHESRQGMREFIAEIVSIGRLRHKSIVQLLGYCRRKGELILVYEYMPNGSLDKYLYTTDDKIRLGWSERFQIIKGIASGLHYLHEYWEQVVIHRDIKASNVLLGGDMNGRLGDFGLARLYNHGTDPHTTRMAGTFGYLAPELARTGKASPLTDVFSFGILLEITCGRRPIEGRAQDTPFILLDWVIEHWHNGSLLEAVDRRLQSDYNTDEACLVLKLGLWCSHPLPNARPSMQQVMLYLEGDIPVPEFVPTDVASIAGFDSHIIHHESSIGTMSGLSGGR